MLSPRRQPEPHPRYRTTSQAYGSKAPTVHDVPVGCGVRGDGGAPGGFGDVASATPTESRSGWSWKGLLEMIESNPIPRR